MNRADAWLTLTCAWGISPAARRKLLAFFGDPEAVVAADVATLRAAGLAPKLAQSLHAAGREGVAARERDRATALGVRIVVPDDAEYPALLHHIDDPPAALFVRGGFEPEDELGVAIVGARRCSAAGRSFTHRLAYDLARAGCTIVSGGARGIDTAAHEGAADAGGRSIAVAGRGLAEPYPHENGPLFERLARRGAVCSELPCDLEPRPNFFPWRNRVIAGLARVVVVVEGRFTSGAAHTVRAATDYNRNVAAVPGKPGDPLAELPNAQLHEGARLVLGAEDVLQELPALAGHVPLPPPLPERPAPTGPEAEIYANVDDTPQLAAEIAYRCEQPTASIVAALTRLELAAHVRALPGGRWVRA